MKIILKNVLKVIYVPNMYLFGSQNPIWKIEKNSSTTKPFLLDLLLQNEGKLPL